MLLGGTKIFRNHHIVWQVFARAACNGARIGELGHLIKDLQSVIVESGHQLSTRCAVTYCGGLIANKCRMSVDAQPVVQGLKIRQQMLEAVIPATAANRVVINTFF